MIPSEKYNPRSPGLKIKERKIIKIEQRKDLNNTGVDHYTRYILNLPKKFVEKHKNDKMYLIVDGELWFGAPDTNNVMKIISVIPQIKKLLNNNTKLNKEQIQMLLKQCPEVEKYIVKKQDEQKE